MRRIPKCLCGLLTLAVVLGLALPAFADSTTKGVIKKVDNDKKEILVTIQGKDYPFQVMANAPIKIGNQDGKLSDLKPNDQVMVTFSQADNKLIATQIVRP